MLKPINRDNKLDRLSDGLTAHWVSTNTLGLIQILLEGNGMIQRMRKALEIERRTCFH